MANEFVHGTVGVSMTQSEFEAVGLHVLNSQATGDVIYASSATQLSRLGIGATNAILTVIGGVPTWQTSLSGLTFVAPALGAATATSINGLVVTTTAGTLTIANNASAALVTSGNYSITLTATAATTITLPTTGTLATLAGTEELDNKTLDSSVGKGTWTASGTWALPVHNSSTITFTADGAVLRSVDNSQSQLSGGTDLNSGLIILYGKSHATLPGMVKFLTPNAALSLTARLEITGGVNTAVLTLSDTTVSGLVLTASQKIYPASGVAGFSVVSTALTLGSLGSVIIPQSAANVTDALAGNVAGAIALDLTGTTERLYFRGASWFYIAKTGGLSMTKEERVDPLGHQFELGDIVELVVDRINPDGSFHALPYYLPPS